MLKRKRSTRLATFVHIPFIKSIIYERVSKPIMLSNRDNICIVSIPAQKYNMYENTNRQRKIR